MIIEILILLVFVSFGFIAFKSFFFSNIHITTSTINVDYDSVWNYFSEPSYYAELFPNWIVNIQKESENRYTALEKNVKNPVEISIEKNKQYGYIKLVINKSEVSQIRIIYLENYKTLAMNIGNRWKGFPYPFWIILKISTNKDYRNAKYIIENSVGKN